MTVTPSSSTASNTSSSTASSTTPAWFAGFQSLETEHIEEVSLPVEGSLPTEVAGTLYRIGPARHDVYGERYRHWFDGDGMVHGLRIDGVRGEVGYRNRFIDTDKKRAEDRARRRIHATFGTPPAGGPIRRIRNFKPANSANTNVVWHAGRMLALCEGGRPHRFDPDTLETTSQGEDSLGVLDRRDTYTAHPKHHPSSGDLIGFGMRIGARTQLRVYRTTSAGHTSVLARIPVPPGAFVHDFSLTETRALFILGRGGIAAPPIGFLLGRTPVYESMPTRNGPTDLWTVDLRSGRVDSRPAPAGLLGFSHVSGAFDTPDGGYVAEGAVYPDVQIIHQMVDLMAGRETDLGRARLMRLSVSGTGAATLDERADVAFEFPRCSDDVATQEHRTVWGLTGFLGSPVRVGDDGGVDIAPLGPEEFSGEPVPIPKAGAASETDSWLLAVVLDASDRSEPRSELRVFDGADLQAPPVARVPLPNVMPFDFHGAFVAA